MIFAVAMALLLTLAACGGGGSDKGSSGSNAAAVETSEANATELVIVASNFEFDKDEYVVKSGEPIDFKIENASGYHGYEIKGLGINIEPGKEKQYTINQPGEYEIVCSIMCGPGHNDMVAKLIVE